MERFSVIIPYIDECSRITRSFECLEGQMYPEELVQIVIVNSTLAKADVLEEFEQKHSETVLVINTETELSQAEAMNIGLQYSSGDMTFFLKPGDALHPNLFRTVNDILQITEVDLVSFKISRTMDEFEDFGDDPFGLENVEIHDLLDAKKRVAFLSNPLLQENSLGYAYSTKLLQESQHAFLANSIDDESIFVYPLLLVASAVVEIPDHGYFSFGGEEILTTEEVVSGISENQAAQLTLLEELKSYKEIFEEYTELIMAHFIRRYYLHSIEMARASGCDEALNLQQFNIMRFVCLKLVPKWIDNDCIYGFTPYEMRFMKLLNNGAENDEELKKQLYSDAKVSVIITTYNRSKVLFRTIKNVLSQTYKRIELLVVDDGSTDGTVSAMGSVSDSRLRYIRNEENQGVSIVRNQGIKNATGTYVMYHDDDDFSRLDKIEKQIRFIQLLPDDYGAVYHETMIHKKDGEENLSDIIPKREMDDVRKKDYMFPALLPKNFVACPSLFIKRDCFKEIGLFDNELVVYEDWDITLRLAKRFKIGFIKEPLYDYYLSDSGLISKKTAEHIAKVEKASRVMSLRYEADRKAYGLDTQTQSADK